MDRTNPASGAEGATVLGPGTEFEGLLSFRGDLRVEGVLSGEVTAQGRLVIAPGARVEAKVEVDELVVAGQLTGDATARQRLELQATGRLVGSVRTPRLTVQDGAHLEGRCETAPRAGAAAPAGRATASAAPTAAPGAPAPATPPPRSG